MNNIYNNDSDNNNQPKDEIISLSYFTRQYSELFGDHTTITDLEKFDHLGEHDAQEFAKNIFNAIDDFIGESQHQILKNNLAFNMIVAVLKTLQNTNKNYDDTETDIRYSTAQQDGSEIKSSQLEELTELGYHYQEQSEVMQEVLNHVKNEYFQRTGNTFIFNKVDQFGKKITASVIDARTFLKNKEKSDAIAKAPQSENVIGIAGGKNPNKKSLFLYLDSLKRKCPDLILQTCGNNKKDSCDYLIQQWANMNNVDLLIEKMTLNPYKNKSAGFKRNVSFMKHDHLMGFAFIETNETGGIMKNLLQKAQERNKKNPMFKIQIKHM